jgi:hypothetical protein
MTIIELNNMTLKARTRLSDFRIKHQEGVSIHVNASEIAINLVEFSLKTTPSRSISKDEEQWFNAGRYIELVIGFSEWSDLSDMYYELVGEVKRRNFFR